LISPIKAIVKARNPTTIEQAKQIARTEELEFISGREAQITMNTNCNNKNNFQCSNNYRSFNTNPIQIIIIIIIVIEHLTQIQIRINNIII